MFSGRSDIRRRRVFWGGAAVVLLLSTLPVLAGAGNSPQEPIRRGDELIYPEGYRIPRYETKVERLWNSQFNPRGGWPSTPPPIGEVRCVAEYEPMESLMISYEGGVSLEDLLEQMVGRITTIGEADVYVMCDSQTDVNNATAGMTAAGANMSRVHFQIVTTDTIWIRDYGPRYIYQGDCRAVVDHKYNRPRPNDDAIPGYFANLRGHAFYLLPLEHGGGNYHLNALGLSNATTLIIAENPTLTSMEIHDIWQDYQNVDTTFRTPFPTSVDLTQHIDMWMQIYDDDKVFISDWPNNVGSTQDNICDNTAADFTNNGWTVTRLSARVLSGPVHYTYTNMVICNDLVLLPSYTNATVSPLNAPTLAAVQAAMPDHTVVQINCQAIVGFAGVMHCIVMHVPAHLGGVNPTAYVTAPNGGATYAPAQVVPITWVSDDDNAVVNVDILLSTDGGANFDTTIVSMTADDGLYNWVVPDVYAPDARIRVVARDNLGNTGFDDSDNSFFIDGTPPGIPGDLVEPFGVVDIFDLFELLDNWGTNGPGADLADSTDVVDIFDLFVMLDNWG